MFTTNSSKIWDMRIDALAALLHYCNVMPHSRVLVLDDTRGLVSAAAAERMGGHGVLWSVALHAGKTSSTEVGVLGTYIAAYRYHNKHMDSYRHCSRSATVHH